MALSTGLCHYTGESLTLPASRGPAPHRLTGHCHSSLQPSSDKASQFMAKQKNEAVVYPWYHGKITFCLAEAFAIVANLEVWIILLIKEEKNTNLDGVAPYLVFKICD